MLTKNNILYAKHDDVYVIKLVGDIRFSQGASLDELLSHIFKTDTFDGFVVDLTTTLMLDSTVLGIIAKIAIFFRNNMSYKPIILYETNDIKRLLLHVGFDEVFTLHCLSGIDSQLKACPEVKEEEYQLANRILDAHKSLMALNAKNQTEFSDVVSFLEQEVKERQ